MMTQSISLKPRHVEELLYPWHLDHRYLTNEDNRNDGESSPQHPLK